MNILAVIRGHKAAGKEHGFNPTWWDAIRDTITDILHYNIITRLDSYIVYEVVHKRCVDSRVALVTSIYVPKKHRGKGFASLLLDAIPEKIVINDRGKHGQISQLVIARRNI